MDQDDKKDEIIIEEEVVEEEGLKDKLKKTRDELKACQQEKADYLAGWQRAKADFINARKDEEKTRGEFVKFTNERILKEILAVADSLEKISSADGVASYKQLIDILKKEGVEPIDATSGQDFDPAYHEAIQQEEVVEKEKDGTILEELQKGYIIHNRVLRPSKVTVGIYTVKEQ